MKIYKSKWYKVLINIILGVFAAFTAFIISGFFFELKYAILIAAVVFVFFVWAVILDNIMEIQVTEDKLVVKSGRKRKEFYLPECSIKAEIDNGSPSLYIKTADGKSEYIDCELVGLSNFECLLDDLKVTGDKAQAIKLETVKKEK